MAIDDLCKTCGIGFILLSGRCDHCHMLEVEDMVSAPDGTSESKTCSQDQLDAARYRFLRDCLQFELGGHNGPDWIHNATESHWFVASGSVFVGTSKPPISLDAAIDVAMNAR